MSQKFHFRIVIKLKIQQFTLHPGFTLYIILSILSFKFQHSLIEATSKNIQNVWGSKERNQPRPLLVMLSRYSNNILTLKMYQNVLILQKCMSDWANSLPYRLIAKNKKCIWDRTIGQGTAGIGSSTTRKWMNEPEDGSIVLQNICNAGEHGSLSTLWTSHILTGWYLWFYMQLEHQCWLQLGLMDASYIS